MRKCFGLILVFGVVASTNAAQNDAAKKDLAAFQGVWQCVSMTVEGKASPKEFTEKIKLTFIGNKGIHPGPGGKRMEATVKLDPSKKPKAIDMTPLSEEEKGKTLLGIYSIKGDVLTICGAKHGHKRPTEFMATKYANLIVLKRVKR